MLNLDEKLKIIDCACLDAWNKWNTGWWNLDKETRLIIIQGYIMEYLSMLTTSHYLIDIYKKYSPLPPYNTTVLASIIYLIKNENFNFMWHVERLQKIL